VGSWAQEGSLVQEGDVWMVSTRPVSEGRFLREDDVVYVTAGSNTADPIGIWIRAGAVTLVEV